MTLRGVLAAVITFASIVWAILGPDEFRWLGIVVVVAIVGLNVLTYIGTGRTQRTAIATIRSAHPDDAVLRTALLALDGSTPVDRRRVIAVVADSAGLSFRDRSDFEVVGVPADRIMAIEIAPLNPRSAVRPAQVTLIDGPPVEFWVGNKPDEQVDAVVALRTALGRAAG